MPNITNIYFRCTLIRIFFIFFSDPRVKDSLRHNLRRPHVSRPIGHAGAHKTVKFHVAEFGEGVRERER